MEKYTFLIPAYKAKYLEEALKSLQQQTLASFKAIVSDDCSPEDIKGTFDKVVGNDPRFKYRRNEHNIGGKSLVAHWNLLLGMCDTEYTIMASDDDVYDVRFLEEMDKLTERHPYVNVLHARAQIIDADGKVTKEDALYKEYVSQLYYLEQLDYYNHIECMANYVLKTGPLKEAGGFVDFPLAWSSDTATTNLLSKNGVVNTQEILFSFRMSGDNISSKTKKNRSIDQKKFKALCMYDAFMQSILSEVNVGDTELDTETYKRVLYNHKKRMSGLIAWMSNSLDLNDFIKYIREYGEKGYIDSKLIIWKKWIKERL